MRIEVSEWIEGQMRMEVRTYELPDGMDRVLIDKTRSAGFAPGGEPYGPVGEVWAFDKEGRQHEGHFVEVDRDRTLFA